MKKRIAAIVLVIVMCIAMLPVSAVAAGGALTRAELAEMVCAKFRPTAAGSGPDFTDIDDCTPAQQAAIKTLAAAGILSGSSDGKFDPHGIATRGMVAVLIWRMSGGAGAAPQEIFDDLEGLPFAPAVDYLVAVGAILPSDAIGSGFGPFTPADAASVSTWLSRMIVEGETEQGSGSEDTPDEPVAGEDTPDEAEQETPQETEKPEGSDGGDTADTPNTDGEEPDLPQESGGETDAPNEDDSGKTEDSGADEKVFIASSWAQAELRRADALGLIPDVLKGQDLTKEITRAEFAAVAVKVYEDLAATPAIPAVINPFTDTADIEVLKAYNVGLTNGTGDGTVYAPDSILTREQLATMLTRVFKRVTMPGWTLDTDSQFKLTYDMPALFDDDADISSWARESVYFMAANKIVEGYGGKFRPRAATPEQKAIGYANATREQALLIAVRMVENLDK